LVHKQREKKATTRKKVNKRREKKKKEPKWISLIYNLLILPQESNVECGKQQLLISCATALIKGTKPHATICCKLRDCLKVNASSIFCQSDNNLLIINTHDKQTEKTNQDERERENERVLQTEVANWLWHLMRQEANKKTNLVSHQTCNALNNAPNKLPIKWPLMPRPESQSNRLQQFSVPQSGAAESTSVSACVSA